MKSQWNLIFKEGQKEKQRCTERLNRYIQKLKNSKNEKEEAKRI